MEKVEVKWRNGRTEQEEAEEEKHIKEGQQKDGGGKRT